MKFPVIFLDEKPITDYLSIFGHGSDSKDYELAIAVWVKRLFEKSTSQSYCVAFALTEDLRKSTPAFNSSKPDYVKKVFEKLRKEDTLIDFLLVKGTAEKHEDIGWGFQLKRFGKGIRSDFIEKLSKFITKKSLVNVEEEGLIVIPDPEEDLNDAELKSIKEGFSAKLLSDKIKIDEKSYKKIFILGKTETHISLTEIFPGFMQISMEN